MEELLSHYNQSKFSPDRYMMMLNRDQDRERGLPLCWLFETKALIGMVLVPMFLLVSFGFESLPLPVLTRLLKAVILDFFRMPLSTKIYFFISLSEWKARVEAQRERGKVKRGGISIVLVLTETSLSNFSFWVVSLFSYLDWKKDKTSYLRFGPLFFLFYFFDDEFRLWPTPH